MDRTTKIILGVVASVVVWVLVYVIMSIAIPSPFAAGVGLFGVLAFWVLYEGIRSWWRGL
jgi:hypothetical protein